VKDERNELTPLWRLALWTVDPIFRLAFKIRFVDVDNVPAAGPGILASNHISALDPIVIAILPVRRGRQIRFLGGAEFFRRRFIGRPLRAFDQIPIERGAHDTYAIDRAVAVARGGALVALFPEGRVNNEPDLLRGRRGAARVAAASGAPLVPVGIWGTQVRYPRSGFNLRRPWRPTVVVVVGEPIPVSTDAGSAEGTLETANQLMSRIEALRDRAKDLAGPKGFPR